VGSTDSGLATTSPRNTFTWTSPEFCQASHTVILIIDHLHAAVEVHTIDTDGWIVFNAQIDVFANTETKVASCRKVALL
jgi:hypothetical protein